MNPPFFGYLDRNAITEVAALLAAGGIAILPTDTIYGFHCAASRREAIERVRRLKGRSGGAGFIHLVADCAMAGDLVSRWPGESRPLLEAIWPARLTAILPARRAGSRAVCEGGRSGSIGTRAAATGGSIAVRVPAREELRTLIAALGEPIVSTSVNISGGAPMTRIAEIAEAFPGLDAYVSQRGRPSSQPSTVVDFTVRPARVVRAGAFRWVFCRGGHEGASAPRVR